MAKRVLVVDDEADVLEALARALRIAGYAVEKAATPERALELVKEHPFDLVVVDFIMPGMSGLELLNRIRRSLPTIRSVVVSGKVDSQIREDEIAARLSVELESDAYFHKPIRNEKLLECISSLLAPPADRDWPDVAERVLHSQKTLGTVRNAERELKPKRGQRTLRKKK